MLAQDQATQIVGLASFGCAALAAAIVAAGRPRGRGVMAAVAAANLLFTADVALGLRFAIGGAVAAIFPGAMDASWWWWQLPLLAGLAAALGAGAWMVARRVDPRARPIVGLTAATAALFAAETVSFHPVDALLYRPLGGMMAIGWVWMMLGVGSVGAAIAADDP